MHSVVDICNIALSRIGRGNILTLTENNQEARQCNRYYDLVRTSVLRDYSWGFAKKIVRLAQTTDTIPGWSYVYAYSNDCLQALKVYNESGVEVKDTDPEHWDIFSIGNNQVIACNVAQAWLEYTSDVKDPSLYSSQFIDALAWRLALDLAMPLTGNSGLRNECTQYYQLLLAQAKSSTANERNPKPGEKNRYLDARR